MVKYLKNTCKGFHFCSNTAGYRIIRAVVCGIRTDNNLITFFTINQFCTRKLQSIWYAAYQFLLFSIASVKLNQIQFVVCFAFLVVFRFFLFSAHLLTTESLLQFTRVSCCFNFRNHTLKNCILAFLDSLLRKHVTHTMSQTLWLHSLSNRENWVIHSY